LKEADPMAENSRALAWRKSRFCGSQSCVEIAFSADTVLVRDSKNPDAARLRFETKVWQAFVADLRNSAT
jgi:hypothetical protein